MSQTVVTEALRRLREAADKLMGAFPTTEWKKVAGPGPETLHIHGNGGIEGLTLEPSCTVHIKSDFAIPEEVEGVKLAGEPLEATLFSLYPAEIKYNGVTVFSEGGVPVAAGPALFTLLPSLKAGANGELEFIVSVPNNQTTPWVQMRFATPSLRMAFEAVDSAWAQLEIANALATTEDEEAAVANAARLVPEALLPFNSSAMSAALDHICRALEPINKKANAHPIHVVGHSHIDMNWLWTWPDTVEVIKRDVRSVLSLMDDYPEFTFSHSQPATYEVIRKEEPDLFEKILRRVREGRWEPLTTCWVEGDVNMASGEAMARQLLEGVTWTREKLGVSPLTFHAPDTFGHAGNLPQLAAQAGAKYYYHHRANPGREDQWPAYWWEGQDGSRILAISTPSYNGEIYARDLASALVRAVRWGLPCSLHFHGIGDHGGGPSRQNLDALRRFRNMPLLSSAFCSTVAAYGEAIASSGATLPEHRGETDTIFEGCYTTHADTKRYNRQGENLLCTADTLTAIAGQNRNDELAEAWRKILFNQFHDILDGSAIHESYEKNAADFDEAKATADAVINSALDALVCGSTPGEIAVINPLGFDRTDWVVVKGAGGEGAVRLVGDNGHETCGQYTPEGLGFAAKAAPFGRTRYSIQPAGAPDTELTVSPAFAKTDNRESNILGQAAETAPYLRVESPAFVSYVRRDCGIIVGCRDKRANRELVGFGMRRASDYMDTARPELALNVFQLIDERPHGMTAWQLQEVGSETYLISGARTTVLESGPAKVVLEVKHAVRNSTIVQKISFYRDLDRIDFVTEVDWREVGTPETGVPGLKASFTARLPECNAWYETPFAAVKRPADGMEVPCLRWADVGGEEYGIAVLNDGKYGCDALGCRLRLNLLRSAYDPDSISDKGFHSIRYALYPHAGDWREAGVVQEGAAFNQPLLSQIAPELTVGASGFTPLLKDAESVQIACVKYAKSGEGHVVRLYESCGLACTTKLAGLPADSPVWETNVVEDKLAKLKPVDGELLLDFNPWQVRTFLV